MAWFEEHTHDSADDGSNQARNVQQKEEGRELVWHKPEYKSIAYEGHRAEVSPHTQLVSSQREFEFETHLNLTDNKREAAKSGYILRLQHRGCLSTLDSSCCFITIVWADLRLPCICSRADAFAASI